MPGGDAPSPESLVGMSAGAVCRAVDDPAGTGLGGVIAAAHEIAYEQGLYRSAWVLEAVALDGTTVWRSPEGDASAEVDPDGTIRDRLRQAPGRGDGPGGGPGRHSTNDGATPPSRRPRTHP